MPHHEISPNVFDCSVCHTRCDRKTVPRFDFEKDVNFSEEIENQIIQLINKQYDGLSAQKTTLGGYPDIEILEEENGGLLCFLEIKGQARTFMSVSRLLPRSGLMPSETLVLNLSDLERYFEISDQTHLPVFLIWCLMRRPCLTGPNPEKQIFIHQHLDVLKQIRHADRNNSRRFRRASGKGDIVNGQHLGVVVNYHFSINEMQQGLPDLSFLLKK